MTLVAYAVRRGLEYYSSTSSLVKRDGQHDPDWKAFVNAGGAVVMVTFIVFTVIVSLVDYAISQVVATLAMIETPTSAISVAPASVDDIAPKSADLAAKQGLLETGPNITLVPQQPITAKIRGTLRHLRAHAGRASPWRGYMNNWLYQASFMFVGSFFENILPKFPGVLIIISAITGALLAQIHVAWTHKVISMPSASKFWQRFVTVADWKALALPAAIKSSATYASLYIISAFVVIFRLDRTPEPGSTTTTGQLACTILQFLTVVAIAFACGLFLCLPAQVTYIRMESSLLPDEQDTIVPFDRTFSGKVTPKIHGGSGRIGFVDAWKSFKWEARRRLIKLYCKSAGIGLALGFLFAQVLILEIWAFMGTAVIAQMKKQQEQAGIQ